MRLTRSLQFTAPNVSLIPDVILAASYLIINVKNVFFTFLTFFLFSKRFFIFKNVDKVQSGKQINKKHFQNNSNEIQWVHK